MRASLLRAFLMRYIERWRRAVARGEGIVSMLNASSSQVLQPLGDALPEAAVAYYSALDAGRWDDAVACFDVGAAYAVPE